VNARLSQHLSVKENVTVVRKDDDGEKVIVSYVVPSQYGSAGLARTQPLVRTELSAELRSFLKVGLAAALLPVRRLVVRWCAVVCGGVRRCAVVCDEVDQ
jgi:acyl-coenzyme A synthetase/AMP-(fatty) acid ligase